MIWLQLNCSLFTVPLPWEERKNELSSCHRCLHHKHYVSAANGTFDLHCLVQLARKGETRESAKVPLAAVTVARKQSAPGEPPAKDVPWHRGLLGTPESEAQLLVGCSGRWSRQSALKKRSDVLWQQRSTWKHQRGWRAALSCFSGLFPFWRLCGSRLAVETIALVIAFPQCTRRKMRLQKDGEWR